MNEEQTSLPFGGVLWPPAVTRSFFAQNTSTTSRFGPFFPVPFPPSHHLSTHVASPLPSEGCVPRWGLPLCPGRCRAEWLPAEYLLSERMDSSTPSTWSVSSDFPLRKRRTRAACLCLTPLLLGAETEAPRSAGAGSCEPGSRLGFTGRSLSDCQGGWDLTHLLCELCATQRTPRSCQGHTVLSLLFLVKIQPCLFLFGP